MPIDPDVAVGAELGTVEFAWTAEDVVGYHLAIGAGGTPGAAELRYVLADRLRALPTFAVVAPGFQTYTPPALSFPGVHVDLAKVLHAGQSITMHAPLPPAGSAIARSRITDVWDKGGAALIVREAVVTDRTGAPLWTDRSTVFASGEGGFGGPRGPSARPAAPDREPDAVLDVPTLPQQALLYRQCGDVNPLHVDPDFAATAGFDRPILHGLCSYGMVCKSIVDNVLAGAVDRVGGYAARFSGVCYPGETLRVRVWTGAGRIAATASVPARGDAPVLGDVLVTLR